MEKLSNNREMVRKLSRVESIFKTYEGLNESLDDASAELEQVNTTYGYYKDIDDSAKITRKTSVYILAFVICLIVAFIGFKKANNSMVGTYVSTEDESCVLTINSNKTFEFESPRVSFDGTWYIEDNIHYTINLVPESDEFFSGVVTDYPDDVPRFGFATPNYENHIEATCKFRVGLGLIIKPIFIILIIGLLSYFYERRSVKKQNMGVDLCKEHAKELELQISLCEDKIYSIESELNDLAIEYQQDFADWYPPKYSYPEAAAYFRELFENSRATTMQEAMDRFEEYIYRNEMLRMQYEHKEMLTQQMELQMDTFNAVNENFERLSEQIETDGAMTRAAVVAEAESIKHKISTEANNINNNIAAEAAGINKNIKKYSPFG